MALSPSWKMWVKTYWVLCKVLSGGIGKPECSSAPLDVQKFSHHRPVQSHDTPSTSRVHTTAQKQHPGGALMPR